MFRSGILAASCPLTKLLTASTPVVSQAWNGTSFGRFIWSTWYAQPPSSWALSLPTSSRRACIASSRCTPTSFFPPTARSKVSAAAWAASASALAPAALALPASAWARVASLITLSSARMACSMPFGLVARWPAASAACFSASASGTSASASFLISAITRLNCALACLSAGESSTGALPSAGSSAVPLPSFFS